MKQCSKCGEIKSLNLFYKRASAKDGHTASCKMCSDKSTNKSRASNKSKYDNIRKRTRSKFRDEMRLYKAGKGCAHCGENHPAVLELHHIDPNVKDLNPSDSTGRKIFYEEVSKCIVLCANCHRKVHYKTECSAA